MGMKEEFRRWAISVFSKDSRSITWHPVFGQTIVPLAVFMLGERGKLQ
jgi:hypothetical protein